MHTETHRSLRETGIAHRASVTPGGRAPAARLLALRSDRSRWALLRLGLIAATALGLVVLTSLHWFNTGAHVSTWAFGSAMLGLTLGGTGALITGRLPENPIGWIFLVGGAAEALTGAAREGVVYGSTTHPSNLSGLVWLALLSGPSQIVGLFTLPLVLLHFPDGALPGPRWRPVRWLTLLCLVATMLLSALTPGSFASDLPQLVNPVGQAWLPVDVLWPAVSVATMVAIVLAAMALLVRWRRSVAESRRALRWVTVTGLVLALEVCLELTPIGSAPVFEYLGSICLILFVGSIALAVLRAHLWDLDVIVNVSLVYAVLTGLVAGVFVAAVGTVGLVFDHTALLWPLVVALGVVAVTLVPMRSAVQTLADRLLYGQRSDPHRLLSRLSRRFTVPESPEDTLQEVVEAVAATYLRLDHVAIRTARRTVTTGLARTETVCFPLHFHGTTLGTLRVAARPGAPLAGRALAAMAELADELAPVVHAVELTSAVTEARRATTTAREEERRRLRRDIHDGLGPSLAAVALQIEGAEALVDRQPGLAKEVLHRLGPEVSRVLDEVRRLVYDLQPPELDALGLAGAVRDLALHFAMDGNSEARRTLEVQVVAPESFGPLPAAVEVAAYRIVGESLANVARHADARLARVTLARVDLKSAERALVVTVDDDGCGPVGSTSYGVGTASMIERATALGGHCGVGADSPLGGLRVRAVLPLGVDANRGDDVDAPETSRHAPR